MAPPKKLAADGVTLMPVARWKKDKWEKSDSVILLELIKENPNITGSIARHLHPTRLGNFETSTVKSKILHILGRLEKNENYDPLLENEPRSFTNAPKRQIMDNSSEDEYATANTILKRNMTTVESRALTSKELVQDAAIKKMLSTPDSATSKPLFKRHAGPLSTLPAAPPAYIPKPQTIASNGDGPEMGLNQRPLIRRMGAGSDVALHDLLWYKEFNLYYYNLFVYGVEGYDLDFNHSSNGQILELIYKPRNLDASFYLDPNRPHTHPRNESSSQALLKSQESCWKVLMWMELMTMGTLQLIPQLDPVDSALSIDLLGKLHRTNMENLD
ncbi:UNVERIFIED_CONTAM: hypothetical protein HDU68_003051 [Siphonaria sp. JEL0065]|nr:hypothetical protein HDU68_003051 [Siphonaria sp. JEL0065]